MITYLASGTPTTTTTFTLGDALIIIGLCITLFGIFMSWLSTRKKSQGIQITVDGQMTRLRARVDQLVAALHTAGIEVPDQPDPPSSIT